MTVLLAAAVLVSALGLLAGVVGAVATGTARGGLPIMLDLWTAAGLLRLASSPGWSSIGAAGALVLVRRLVLLSLGSRPPQRA